MNFFNIQTLQKSSKGPGWTLLRAIFGLQGLMFDTLAIDGQYWLLEATLLSGWVRGREAALDSLQALVKGFHGQQSGSCIFPLWWLAADLHTHFSNDNSSASLGLRAKVISFGVRQAKPPDQGWKSRFCKASTCSSWILELGILRAFQRCTV